VVYEAMSRTDAARIGSMDRQALGDWVHRFNDEGTAGLVSRPASNPSDHDTGRSAVKPKGGWY